MLVWTQGWAFPIAAPRSADEVPGLRLAPVMAAFEPPTKAGCMRDNAHRVDRPD
jgi:hypothetical protein